MILVYLKKNVVTFLAVQYTQCWMWVCYMYPRSLKIWNAVEGSTPRDLFLIIYSYFNNNIHFFKKFISGFAFLYTQCWTEIHNNIRFLFQEIQFRFYSCTIITKLCHKTIILLHCSLRSHFPPLPLIPPSTCQAPFLSSPFFSSPFLPFLSLPCPSDPPPPFFFLWGGGESPHPRSGQNTHKFEFSMKQTRGCWGLEGGGEGTAQYLLLTIEIEKQNSITGQMG